LLGQWTLVYDFSNLEEYSLMWRFFTRQAGKMLLDQRFGGVDQVRVLKKGPAMRIIFFYPGEEGTYVDNANVTLYDNGVVHIKSNQEETTTHLQNCEILWHFEVEAEDRANKVRLLKPKTPEGRIIESTAETKPEGKPPSKGGPSKNPDLR
jgi:hypothetical protein